MTHLDANPQDRLPAVKTHVLLRVAGSFLLPATCCAACLVVVSSISKVPTQVTAAPAEAKWEAHSMEGDRS
jgi:hypothetical protein